MSIILKYFKELFRYTNNKIGNAVGVKICQIGKETPILCESKNVARLSHFYDLLEKVRKVDGNIVECGVGWGRSLFMFCVLSNSFNKDRYIWGFDSFQGFSEPSSSDRQDIARIRKGHYKTSQAGVLRYLVNSGVTQDFINNKVKLIGGFFCDTLNRYDGKSIALLHLDVDLYNSYKECLEVLYPKVTKGGVIVFDEYQSDTYIGARKAIDEFFLGKTERILKSKFIDRYYVVKV